MPHPNSELILFLVIGTGGMLVLVVAIISFTIEYQRRRVTYQLQMDQLKLEYQEKLLKEYVQAQEQEQRRIAEDLHDELGPSLSAAVMEVSRINSRASPEAIEDATNHAVSILRNALTEVRRVAHNIYPPMLEQYGLVSLLETLSHRYHETGVINFTFELLGKERRLPSDIELVLYRIVMELINNTLKYAQAKTITLILHQKENEIIVRFTDDGIGFDPASVAAGIGLKSVKNRARILKGDIHITSGIGEGVRVEVKIPIPEYAPN